MMKIWRETPKPAEREQNVIAKCANMVTTLNQCLIYHPTPVDFKYRHLDAYKTTEYCPSILSGRNAGKTPEDISEIFDLTNQEICATQIYGFIRDMYADDMTYTHKLLPFMRKEYDDRNMRLEISVPDKDDEDTLLVDMCMDLLGRIFHKEVHPPIKQIWENIQAYAMLKAVA
jgi:hypothetical protein